MFYSNRPDPVRQPVTTCFLDTLISVKGDSTVFVETGTNSGKGVENALDAGFKSVISIEIVKILYDECVKKFEDCDNVKLIHGCSRKKLFPVIKNIKEKMLFWLDGHEYHDIPLVEELNQIKSLKRNDHIIMIDDVRMFGTEIWGGFQLQTVLDLIMEINPEYKISYLDSYNQKNDILVATVD
jgi:hypothetical protein